MLASVLFSWVQSAPEYRRLHRDAVDLVGPGGGRTWLDVGCGPGLVAELAAARGFAVTAIDRDPAMVRLAARRSTPAAAFTVRRGDVDDPLPPHDVVSAASLLCQLSDPVRGLQSLWSAVRPGGTLLVVETTERMSPEAVRHATRGVDGHSRRVLTRWAAAREGHALSSALWDELPAESTRVVSLLDGCVCAVVARKAVTSSSVTSAGAAAGAEVVGAHINGNCRDPSPPAAALRPCPECDLDGVGGERSACRG